jgi:hypothetical protein
MWLSGGATLRRDRARASSTGTLLLFRIVIGALAMLGLSVLLPGALCTAHRGPRAAGAHRGFISGLLTSTVDPLQRVKLWHTRIRTDNATSLPTPRAGSNTLSPLRHHRSDHDPEHELRARRPGHSIRRSCHECSGH